MAALADLDLPALSNPLALSLWRDPPCTQRNVSRPCNSVARCPTPTTVDHFCAAAPNAHMAKVKYSACSCCASADMMQGRSQSMALSPNSGQYAGERGSPLFAGFSRESGVEVSAAATMTRAVHLARRL